MRHLVTLSGAFSSTAGSVVRGRVVRKMKIAVAGGTGVAGRATVEALRALGHEPVVVARSAGIDLVSGKGLADGLVGADAVIDTTNISTMSARTAMRFFEATAGNLTRAAERAGVGHIVVLSIIGIDRVPYSYYKGKIRQEEVLRDSPVPVTILRAAQFHEFPVQFLAQSKGRFLVVPKMRTQPVAVREVGAALARIAAGSPAAMPELAGPREEVLADMIRQVIRARGDRRRVIEVRLPGAAGKAMAAGGTLPGEPGPRGTQTFAAWLREQQASGTL
jgi:uncharacterized protein YbjT (DUF2867 family)